VPPTSFVNPLEIRREGSAFEGVDTPREEGSVGSPHAVASAITSASRFASIRASIVRVTRPDSVTDRVDLGAPLGIRENLTRAHGPMPNCLDMRAVLFALLIAVPGADAQGSVRASCRVRVEIVAGARVRGEGRAEGDAEAARAQAWHDACERLRAFDGSSCEDETRMRVVKRSLTTRPISAAGSPPGLEHVAVVEILPIRQAAGRGSAPRSVEDACHAALADACARAISNTCPEAGVTIVERHADGPPTM
jgi:hypothetical protein